VKDVGDLLRIHLILHGRRMRVKFIDPRDRKLLGSELGVPLRFLTSESVEGKVILRHDARPWTGEERGLALHPEEWAARWETGTNVYHGERVRSLAALVFQPRAFPPERSAQSPLLFSFELGLDLELGQTFALGLNFRVEFVDALLVCENS